jgi:hypothetical protein
MELAPRVGFHQVEQLPRMEQKRSRLLTTIDYTTTIAICLSLPGRAHLEYRISHAVPASLGWQYLEARLRTDKHQDSNVFAMFAL